MHLRIPMQAASVTNSVGRGPGVSFGESVEESAEDATMHWVHELSHCAAINVGLQIVLLLCASSAWSQTPNPDGQEPVVSGEDGQFSISVDVTSTQVEQAQRQIEAQEKQRLFGVLPNFLVSYLPDAAPLSARQKFELTGKSRLDPVRFGVTGIVAGIQQARSVHSGFGDGAEGYAKRYAAEYVNGLTRSMLTQVVLPSLFRQDPRYFYKGTGSTTSRMGYAMSRAVIVKGDNGHWQPNYSGILGSLASGALSNLYYPAEDRKGVRLTLENAAFGIGGAALGHLAQEFLFRRVTSHSRKNAAPAPASAVGARDAAPAGER